MPVVRGPEQGENWFAVTTDDLPVAQGYEWAVVPSCGAVVLFSGTVRDHAEGRTGVTHLDYEAYEEQVVPRFTAIAASMRERWPAIGRIAIWHRVGRLRLGESSVVVVVSAPHRDEAFDAARFGIDTVKASAPIWKRESWEGGEAWGTDAQPIADVHAHHGASG